eukprot:UN13976
MDRKFGVTCTTITSSDRFTDYNTASGGCSYSYTTKFLTAIMQVTSRKMDMDR